MSETTGQEARANGATSNENIHPISPIDLRPLPAVRVSSVTEIADAVASARVAQADWRRRPFEDRVAALTRAAKTMLRKRAEVMALAREEMGKVDCEAMFNEALGPLDAVSAWAKVVRRGIAREQVRLNPLSFPNKRAYIDMVPRGVVGIIAPWNFPVAGLYRATLPALLSGNAIVVKPSEYTPRTSAWFVEQLAAELPVDLAQVVQGPGKVGEALIGAGIDACVFTGSPRTGRNVAVRCAERGIPSSVEMGGKDAAIVLADCDLDRTVAAITTWALANAGQACGAIEVAYVESRIADELVERLRRSFAKLRYGVGPFGSVEVAPLANRRQLEIVSAQVEEAKKKGARVVCGGVAGEGLAYAPTLIDRCDETMSVVRDETFGPVLAIVRIDGVADAIRQIDESRYGLGASIWTRDIARAERLAERLDVGVVNINNHAFTGAIPALPWSGTRETGFGVANSHHALATFVRPKTVAIDGNDGPDAYWMPYETALWEMGDLLADAQLGIVARAWRLPLIMRRRAKAIVDFFR